MTDLRKRFRELDRLGQPDVWERIGHVPVRPVPPQRPAGRWGAAALAFAVAAASVGFAAWAFYGGREAPGQPRCQDRFQPIGHPEFIADRSVLIDIAAVSSTEVWAVGHGGSVAGRPVWATDRALTFHWDGTEWQTVPAAEVTTTTNRGRAVQGRIGFLTGVSATAPDDAWAVGYAGGSLIEHWDGRSWVVVPVADPGVLENVGLTDVVALDRDDAWAVGTALVDGRKSALAMHWDGSRWEAVPTPRLEPHSYLYAVAGTGSGDVWAVGEEGGGLRGNRPLVERWDGERWTVIPVPTVGGAESQALTGVSVVAEDDVWAVGTRTPVEGERSFQPMVLHGDGAGWERVSIPLPDGADGAVVERVAASSSGDVWVVGSALTEDLTAEVPLTFQPLVLHWDGEDWSIVPFEGEAGRAGPVGVTALPNGRVWISGSITAADPSDTSSAHRTFLAERVCMAP